jgi:hypothetical protein
MHPPEPTLEGLRIDYENAFDEWTLQVSAFQRAGSSSSRGSLDAAEAAYRRSRDRFAASLMKNAEDR